MVALNNHRQRIDADLAVAIDKEGQFIGKLTYDKSSSANTESDFLNMLDLNATDENRPILYDYQGNVYQVVLVPVKSGNVLVAWIGFGFAVDRELAEQLSVLTGMNIDSGYQMEGRWTLLASSNPDVAGNKQLTTEKLKDNNKSLVTPRLR